MKDPKKEMTFVDHLEELRWHVVRSVIAVIVLTIIAFASMNFIFHQIILAPVKPDFWTYRMLCLLSEDMCIKEINFTMQNRSMAGQFTMHVIASFVTGVILAFPYVFWELWRFIKPGLHSLERKYSAGAGIFVTTLFVTGIMFGYFIVGPLSINFLINYKLDDSIVNNIDVTSYISFLCLLVLGSGIMFQLPVVIYILSRIGIVTPSFLRTYRKHAIVAIFIIAAIFTPSPDFFTQLIVAIPLMLLYEISIFISVGVYKKRQKDLGSTVPVLNV
jgi:sec-independent protein translocase protein TatC